MSTDTDLLDQMRAGVEQRHPIIIRNAKVYVRPLTIQETLEVAETVQALMAKMSDAEKTRMHEHTILAKETLKRACVANPGDHEKSPGQFTEYTLSRMTNDEVHSWYKQWADICEKVSPKLETIPADKLKELVEALKKSPSEVTELSFSQLAEVARYLLTSDG